jgi:hypothetical protein
MPQPWRKVQAFMGYLNPYGSGIYGSGIRPGSGKMGPNWPDRALSSIVWFRHWGGWAQIGLVRGLGAVQGPDQGPDPATVQASVRAHAGLGLGARSDRALTVQASGGSGYDYIIVIPRESTIPGLRGVQGPDRACVRPWSS